MLGLSSVFSTKHCNIKKLILNQGLFDTKNYDIEIILQKEKEKEMIKLLLFLQTILPPHFLAIVSWAN